MGSTSFNAKKSGAIAPIYPFGGAEPKEAAVCVRHTALKGLKAQAHVGTRRRRARAGKGHIHRPSSAHNSLRSLCTPTLTPGPGPEAEAGVAHGLRETATPGTSARGRGWGRRPGPRHWVPGTHAGTGEAADLGETDRGRAGGLGHGAVRSEPSSPRGLVRPARRGAHSAAKATAGRALSAGRVQGRGRGLCARAARSAYKVSPRRPRSSTLSAPCCVVFCSLLWTSDLALI